MILQRELPGCRARRSSVQSSALCASVRWLPLIQAAEEKIGEIRQRGAETGADFAANAGREAGRGRAAETALRSVFM